MAQGRYTLIVPTFNRPKHLGWLLGYLQRHAVKFPIHILDSSEEKARAQNRETVRSSGLATTHIEFPSSMPPFEKFWRGTQEVKTPYASFCADDDVVLVQSLDRVLDHLEATPDCAVAHGWYFNFHMGETFDLVSMLYHAPSIAEPDALDRLYRLMSNYEAITYGVYRTGVLQEVLRGVQSVETNMARELLGSALSVVAGTVHRLPVLYQGRSMEPSLYVSDWHPIDYLISSPERLFNEYASYRQVIVQALAGAGVRTDSDVETAVDQIHWRYISSYFRPAVLDYLYEKLRIGASRQEIMAGMWNALLAPEPAAPAGSRTVGDRFRRAMHRVAAKFGRRRFPKREQVIVRRGTNGSRREYRIKPEFRTAIAPSRHLRGALEPLLRSLDAYTVDGERLLQACANGDLPGVNAVRLQSPDVVGYHARAMMEACAAGALDCVVHLHQKGIGVGPWDLGFALAAARGGHADVLRYLAAVGLRLEGTAADLSSAARKRLRPPINQVLAQDEERLSSNQQLALEMVAAAQRREKNAVKILHERGAQPIRLSAKSRINLHLMRIELESADPIYHPSKFWEVFNASNMLFLGWGGEENFKRTLNQNYFNYIPEDPADPKLAALDAYERERGPLPLQDYEIEDPDHDPALWWSWYDSYLLLKGSDRERRLTLYKRFVASYYERALQADRLGILTGVEEPLLGNPIRIRRRAKLISQDLANAAVELNTVFSTLGSSTPSTWFAELGAGYGRVAALLLARLPGRYAIFDIPPALHVAQWYLSGLFPKHRVFRFRQFDRYTDVKAELARAQIAFFTPNQLALLPDQFFDAGLTISSLHEMRLEQIHHYLGLLGRKTRKLLYLKQQWNYANPHDEVTITEANYPAPDGWRTALQQSDRLNPEFFERVLTRDGMAARIPI